MQSLEAIVEEFRYLAKHWRPNILYRSKKAIIFREAEDLIAWLLKKPSRVIAFSHPAWRFYVCEDGGNRYYYRLEGLTSPTSDDRIWLIAGDATDYSGHGSHDKQLIETFIKRCLGMEIEDRPASYLIDDLIALLAKEV